MLRRVLNNDEDDALSQVISLGSTRRRPHLFCLATRLTQDMGHDVAKSVSLYQVLLALVYVSTLR